MRISALYEKAGRWVHEPRFHVVTVVLFVLVLAAGHAWDGFDFVKAWGGSIAAVIATVFLVWKSRAYWAWMMVNAGLWVALFFEDGLNLFAWLQVSFLLFCGYGIVYWAVVRSRTGFDVRARVDRVGAYLGLGIGALAAWAYYPDEMSVWWALEAGGMLFAILAIWMDAYRYKANWIMWSLSNACSAPLFWHFATAVDGKYWGPFATLFVYQAINVVGYYEWWRAERELAGADVPPLTGTRPA